MTNDANTFNCPGCQIKMRCSTVAASYRCPKCNVEFRLSDSGQPRPIAASQPKQVRQAKSPKLATPKPAATPAGGRLDGPFAGGALASLPAAIGTTQKPTMKYNPAAARGRPASKSSGNGLSDSTFRKLLYGCIALVVAGLVLGVLSAFVFSPGAAIISVGLMGIASLMITVVGVWLLVIAFKEDTPQGLLCLFVPFFIIYFVATHWATCRQAALLTLAAIGMSIAGVVVIGVLAVATASQMDPADFQGTEGFEFSDETEFKIEDF